MKDKDYEQLATNIMMNALEGVKAQIRKAYDKGYKDGKADTPFTDTEEAEKKAYERGLSDAWEMVRKIIEDVVDGGYSSDVLRKIFGVSTVQSIFKLNTASEAIAKIKEYEDKQKQDAEIKVGDEVTTISGSKGIVITDEPSVEGDISVWLSTCTHVQLYPVKKLLKTGRTYPQIAEVLEKMRGAEND